MVVPSSWQFHQELLLNFISANQDLKIRISEINLSVKRQLNPTFVYSHFNFQCTCFREIVESQSLPQTQPKYSETNNTKRNRKIQMNHWIKHVECCGNISLMVADTTASLMGSSIHEPDSRHFDTEWNLELWFYH